LAGPKLSDAEIEKLFGLPAVLLKTANILILKQAKKLLFLTKKKDM
jgi:hypothetical protein